MKQILLSLAISLACYSNALAQPEWEKVKDASRGDGQTSTDPSRPYKDKDYNYGSESNPSPRTDAVTWTDQAGTLWVFGGIGLDEKYQWGIFGDMWSYNAESNSWTFVKGDRNNVNTDPNLEKETPKPRKDAASWTDPRGNLWLYGGKQLGELLHLDDLWKFDPQTENWTKISGSSSFNTKPSYGTQKSAAVNNSPGSRSSSATWTDKNGNLWLFGGISYDPKSDGKSDYYNDLWKFDTEKNQWSWITGSDKANQTTVATSKSASAPSSRADASLWYDNENNQLWLYGGIGIDSTGTTVTGLSDMWVFSIEKNTWQFKSGSQRSNLSPDVFSARSEHKRNSPGARISPVSWTGKPGLLYLVGGNYQFTKEQVYIDKTIWVYSTESNLWSILPQTEIPAITSATSFKDQNGTIYLFGGKEFDKITSQTRASNSIWKLTL